MNLTSIYQFTAQNTFVVVFVLGLLMFGGLILGVNIWTDSYDYHRAKSPDSWHTFLAILSFVAPFALSIFFAFSFGDYQNTAVRSEQTILNSTSKVKRLVEFQLESGKNKRLIVGKTYDYEDLKRLDGKPAVVKDNKGRSLSVKTVKLDFETDGHNPFTVSVLRYNKSVDTLVIKLKTEKEDPDKIWEDLAEDSDDFWSE